MSTFEHWQQQLSEAKKANKLDRLTELQRQVLDALNASGEWLTRRQICEAIGVTWSERGRSGDARKVGDSLQRLVELGAVESARSGTEATFRASRETQETTVTTVPTSDSNGSQCHEQPRDNRDREDDDQPLSRLSRTGRDTENACGNPLARLSRTSPPTQVSHPVWLPQLLAIREANPEGHPYTWGLLMAKHGLPSLAGPKVQEALRRWDAQIDCCLVIEEEEA